MKKSTPLLLFCIFMSLKAFTQPAFTLPDANKMLIDPAFTATDTCYKRTISLYSQGGFPYSPSTPIFFGPSVATFQMNLNKINSGVGIMMNYNSGIFNTYTILNQVAAKLYYRYTILPGLSIGTDAGFVNVNMLYVVPDDWYFDRPTQLPKLFAKSFDFDGGFGISYQLKSLYAGFAIDHITSPHSTIPGSFDPLMESSKIAMPYYSGISYNAIIDDFIGSEKGGVDLSVSYCDFNLNTNIRMVMPHFFIGFSEMLGNYYSSSGVFTVNNNYLALMGGIKVFRKKIMMSVSISFPQGGETLLIPLEGEISSSF